MTELSTVRILGMPFDVMQRSAEHSDELLREFAHERGEETIDLSYEVPAAVAAATRRLGTLLDEADEFCRAGDLLTLATQPQGVAFRHWYLDEFQRQIDGRPPRPWSAPVVGS